MHSVVHAQDVSYMISPENVFGPADPGVLLTDWPGSGGSGEFGWRFYLREPEGQPPQPPGVW